MKNAMKKAIKLAMEIEHQYMLLEGDSDFFNTYHDVMKIQSDCAWQVVDEMECNKTKVHDDMDLISLQDCLEYCKAVIELQTKTNDLPLIIFG
jgi:hypothetical protein